jgi:hypothetical protein
LVWLLVLAERPRAHAFPLSPNHHHHTTDSSNEDWGWRFTATAYYKKQHVYEDAHWLVQLKRHLIACNAALTGGLVASLPWQGELEERNRVWMEELLQGGGGNAAPRPQEAPERAFLQSLVTRPPGSPAAALVQAMRRLVPEDRGRHPPVDAAVYAAVAALLQHNGLVREAMAVAEQAAGGGSAEGVLPEGSAVPAALLRVWRAGAKMRHFFAFADVRAAAGLQGPAQGQPQAQGRPSLYEGAEDAVVEAAAKEVVERAQFLLELPPPSSSSAAAGRARGLSLSGSLAAAPPAPVAGGDVNKEGQWAAVVEELHASSPTIMEVFAHRRREAERMQASQLTTTERVLRFLQVRVFVL